ncbi:MAG TPA: hypothetical protein DEB17_07990 [Chlorobaculum sp.]|uniref:Uncharacterized protein n=1 Tax=Chlorobaculum tepidum (strain ATCC 49652 / DSM 12025 / NBRC 103806 / TLS) TaxID=194439 RepID=Q8KD39_CHLTE|nr:hypothetical protein CT1216 [Chlorobaculum tepidum TLS]HBU23912.1 hypothetical protein [Chlorobaculum sp.]
MDQPFFLESTELFCRVFRYEFHQNVFLNLKSVLLERSWFF